MISQIKFGQKIQCLNLANNKISTLPHFENSELIAIGLNKTNFDDAGLFTLFKECKAIQAIALNETKITESSLPLLRQMQHLEYVCLPVALINVTTVDLVAKRPTSMSFEMIQSFSDNLIDYFEYDFANSKITDKGVMLMQPNSITTMIFLSNTSVGDASLMQLAKFPKLQIIRLEGTLVTEKGVLSYCDSLIASPHEKNTLSQSTKKLQSLCPLTLIKLS